MKGVAVNKVIIFVLLFVAVCFGYLRRTNSTSAFAVSDGGTAVLGGGFASLADATDGYASLN